MHRPYRDLSELWATSPSIPRIRPESKHLDIAHIGQDAMAGIKSGNAFTPRTICVESYWNFNRQPQWCSH
ncbi:hypothetical protein B7494_g1451 [Chlorociboria aeruginascens]|nr:hypothetical protein B7494_g1451 [Chlorociboria aeruginascens]